MKDYAGVPCAQCNRHFTAEDDIVVCPECGAPYHRSCYNQNNTCVCAHLHQSGQKWSPPSPVLETARQSSPDAPQLYCVRCDSAVEPGASRCEHCGMLFFAEGARPDSGETSPFDFRFMMDPLYFVDPEEYVTEDVRMRDMARHVRQNVLYYVGAFGDIRRRGKARFNFAAFLFSGVWLLHRKVYRLGAAITFLTGGLSLIVSMVFGNDITSYINEAVFAAGSGGQTAVSIFDAAASLMSAPPNIAFPLYIGMFTTIASFIVQIILGIYGNRIYYNSCLRKVREIKEETSSTEEYYTNLAARGGVNSAVSYFVFFLLYFLPGIMPPLSF